MRLFPKWVEGTGAIGLLLVRVVVGAAFMLHGYPKIMNATGWMGADATVPPVAQVAAAVAEFGGGIGLILGLATPLWALLLVGTMGVAIQMVHLPQHHPFVASSPHEPSFELALVYLAINLLLLLLGPGRLSVDALIFGRKSMTIPNVK